MKYLIIFALLICRCAAQENASNIEPQSLFRAFSSVFQLKDTIEDGNTKVLRQAYLQLEKMGLSENLGNICSLDSDTLSLILMKAALGEFILGLRDPNDWNIVIANAETGRLERQRSFSATRFAVIESLLIICIVALGRVIWLK